MEWTKWPQSDGALNPRNASSPRLPHTSHKQTWCYHLSQTIVCLWSLTYIPNIIITPQKVSPYKKISRTRPHCHELSGEIIRTKIKGKEVIRESRNIWKWSKNKLKTESINIILHKSNTSTRVPSPKNPPFQNILIFSTLKRVSPILLFYKPGLVYLTNVGYNFSSTIYAFQAENSCLI